MSVGKSIKSMINERGMKQTFVAQKIGVSDTLLSSMLTGRSRIDSDLLPAICEAIGVSPEDVFARADELFTNETGEE